MAERPSALVVVQRYGDVSGGAEAHARTLVERLATHLDIEVATTTARDYWTWANAFTPGLTWINGVAVRRFPVERGRARDFRLREHRAFAAGHSLSDEIAFVDAQGPIAPDLLEHVRARGGDFDHVLFFQYLYHPTVNGLPLVPERAVLVPTAHEEPAIGLTVYRRVFHLPRAIAYNTDEERRMVQRRFRNERVPGDVVGVGVDVPSDRDAPRFRSRHRIDGPYFLYVGRIVQGKQIRELCEAFARWQDRGGTHATLVLMGQAEMSLPAHPAIRPLGRTTDEEKFDALTGCVALLQPSLLESLSIIVLEAWACERPVICDARSPVVWGMTRCAGAGVAYRDPAELAEICELLIEDARLGDRLGALGRAFVERSYTWRGVVEKYLDLFAEVRARNT